MHSKPLPWWRPLLTDMMGMFGETRSCRCFFVFSSLLLVFYSNDKPNEVGRMCNATT